MVASVNKVMLIGNLGADPDVRALPSGEPVAHFSVATTDRRSNDKGGYVDVTEWHRIALYGKQAEVARQYLKKGSQVYVEGKLRTSVWTDREGVERKTWNVVADRMQMLGKPEVRTLGAGHRDDNDSSWMDSPPPNSSAPSGSSPTHPVSADDEIPF